LLVEQEAMEMLHLDQLLQLVVEVKEVVVLHQEQLEQQILEEVEVQELLDFQDMLEDLV
jgi:hypothetical protein